MFPNLHPYFYPAAGKNAKEGEVTWAASILRRKIPLSLTWFDIFYSISRWYYSYDNKGFLTLGSLPWSCLERNGECLGGWLRMGLPKLWTRSYLHIGCSYGHWASHKALSQIALNPRAASSLVSTQTAAGAALLPRSASTQETNPLSASVNVQSKFSVMM